MQEFIKSAVSQLGIDESTATNATGTALGFLKNMLGDQFAEVADKLPGADQLIGETAPSHEPGDGGLLGTIKNAASSILGGGAGESMELIGALQKTGLSADQGSSFITMLINFIKEKVGPDVVNQIMSKLPMLKSMVG